jgi:4-diphosphocytidyl-2-C-methyl-D-erythritol kinase
MQITRNAYAKINLGLDVLRKREDGYHEVKMIMQMVDLYDTLTFSPREDAQICIQTDNQLLPCDRDNLIYRAAQVLFEAAGQKIGADIFLEKRIPIAAGMAGGSTDAAATLLVLNELLDRPLTQQQLQEIAVGVGADVPYCVLGGTALSEGIGEILTPLSPPPQASLVIAKPDISVSTAFVYGNLHLDEQTVHPDIDGMCHALADGSLSGITQRLGNVLETVTVPAYPIIGKIKQTCMEAGAAGALMSGSGPTVFAIFEDELCAQQAAQLISSRQLAREVFVTDFLGV